MRKIVVTSGKGGVGKTTVTATLGRKLSNMGYRVCLVDADVGLNNLDVIIGIDNRVVYDINDVLLGKCRVYQALVKDSDSGLRVLPSSKEHSMLTAQAFRGIVDSLVDFDFVLIDCPAGIENGFHRAVSSADEGIVVTTPSASAIRDADKVVNLLHTYRLSEISLVVNRVRADMVRRGDVISAREISLLLHLPVVGIVPEDDNITLFQQFTSVPNYALSDKAFEVLAENIAMREQKFVDISSKKRRLRWV